MRVLLTLMGVLSLLGGSAAIAQPAAVDDLPRRAELGAVLRPPTATAPAQVVRVSPDSPLARAGLQAGDLIRSFDGRPFADAIDFDRRLAALRAGHLVQMEVTRQGAAHKFSARLPPMPLERLSGVETVYTVVRNPRGIRQRAILTRPERSTRRLPAVLFVPWMSCDSVESPGRVSPGIDELLQKMAIESGWAMLRVDKPGVGDSEGSCADTDLDTEIDGSRAALAWLRRHPWIDPDRIVIMGQSFSGAFLPMVALDTPVAGYIVINSWVRTWLERLLEFERLQAERSGMGAADVSERQRQLAQFYAMYLEQQKTPRQVIDERPELGGVWDDAPEHQYGRSARFHHQLQRVNAAAGWSGVSVPTLVMWGDADIVMHRIDHERMVAMVNRNGANAAELVIVPGADHAMAAKDASGRLHLPTTVPDAIRRFLNRVSGPPDGA